MQAAASRETTRRDDDDDVDEDDDDDDDFSVQVEILAVERGVKQRDESALALVLSFGCYKEKGYVMLLSCIGINSLNWSNSSLASNNELLSRSQGPVALVLCHLLYTHDH